MASVRVDRSGVDLKLARAREQLAALVVEVREWQQQPWGHRFVANDDFTEHQLTLVLPPRPPLRRWGMLFGEIAQSTRSALDHLVYAIAVAESGTEPPPKATTLMFPILEPPSPLAVRRIETLGDAARAAIIGEQPNPDHLFDSPLYELNRISNLDKHRLVPVTVAQPADSSLPLEGAVPGMRIGVNFNFDGLEHGRPFATVYSPAPNPGLAITIDEFGLGVFLGIDRRAWGYDPGAPFTRRIAPVDGMANRLIDHAEGVVDRVLKKMKRADRRR